MKNKLQIIAAFCVALSLVSIKLSAQLSGLYTINQGIAASPTNFISFQSLAAALTASGVAGPVTVDVVTGTGPYVQQASFGAIAGTSGTNSITVNGNGNTITFNATLNTAPHTIALSGADFMFFNNLNIVGTNALYALVVHLWNQSNNNAFSNCVMTCNPNLTSITVIPYSLSGSGTSGTTIGDSGNNNSVISCTLNNGYYNATLYGNSVSPFNTGNKVINSIALDSYVYNVINAYCQTSLISGNTMERPTRTTLTTGSGCFISTNSYGIVVENNKIRRLFDGFPTSGSTCYGIYIGSAGQLGAEIVVRNNVISNITCNGTIYGIYNGGYAYDLIYHNSIVMDNVVSTAGTIYGIISYAPAPSMIKNNLISINRTGSGTKYCLYFGAATMTSNNNILFNNSPAGVNGIGYYNGATYTTLNAWKGAGSWDQNSLSADPLFANPGLFDYTPTAPSLNNAGQPLGVATDVTGFARNLPAPDAGAYEFFNTQCTGTPGTNTVTAPSTIVCPAALSSLGLLNTYTVNGLNYQWGFSTVSNLGPYTAIPGATLASYITPTLSGSTWYSATITCQNGGLPTFVTGSQVQIATTIVSSVPYYEGFEGINNNNELPNCSWLVNNTNAQTRISSGINNQVPNTGNKFATVYGYNLSGTNHYWTNGIQLYAGVTYSASMFYTTEYYGYTNFSELSMLVGTSQSTVGLTNIATAAGPVMSPIYKQLANTFTVPTSGIYYVAVKVVSTAGSFAYYLSWDDLSITIPCELNQTNISLTGTTASTLCSGQPVNLTATGANSYTWSTGVNTSTITDYPTSNTSYVVMGTSTLTGCSATVVKNVVVKPTPQISIVSFNPNVCEGKPVTLNAVGATTYTWSTGTLGSIMTAIPATATTYTVVGSNSSGCVGMSTQLINVNPAPNVSATNVPATSCPGDNIIFTGSGATTYSWVSNSLYTQGTQVIISSPAVSTIYTVTGMDANGCSKSVSIVQQVAVCTGIKAFGGSIQGLNVYPNPTSGAFTVELFNGLTKNVELSDVTGRIILSESTTNDSIEFDVNNLSNGVYYIKVKSENSVEVLKIVKQ